MRSFLSLAPIQSSANSLGTTYKKIWKIWTLNIYYYFHCCHFGQNHHQLSTTLLFLTNWAFFLYHHISVLNSIQINHSFIFKIQIMYFSVHNLPMILILLCLKTKAIMQVYYLFFIFMCSLPKLGCKQTDFWLISYYAPKHVRWLTSLLVVSIP